MVSGAQFTNVGERARDLARLALHDPETGLLNRLGLEQALIDLTRKAQAPVVFAVFGVADSARAGALIAQAGARLTRIETDWIIGRLGPEALGVALVADLGHAQARVAAAQAGLADQGLAGAAGLASSSARDAVGLMAHAEIALGQARAAGAPLAVYDNAAHGAEDAALMADMEKGLARGEFSLLHQPKLDLRTGAVAGVEALVRWMHPARGAVSPDLFVPVAEEAGRIRALTEWTLARAAADARTLAAEGRDLVVSVNISGRLLGDADFAAAAIAHAEGARLCFEITETAMIETPSLAAKMIADFSGAGLEISIDDFGARMSSFDYLQRIAAQELKIDKSFVAALVAGARGEALMAATIDLAHTLGLKVTVEGIETRGALDQVKALGADMAQGNVIAPPLTLANLNAFLSR